MTIDSMLERLNKINQLLEDDISLDDSIKYFNEGVKLAEEINSKLSDYKGKITIIKDRLKAIEENFSIDE